MRFAIYVGKPYIQDVEQFKNTNGKCSSRVICSLIRNFNNVNVKVDIPTLRRILVNDTSQLKRVKELIEEIERVY